MKKRPPAVNDERAGVQTIKLKTSSAGTFGRLYPVPETKAADRECPPPVEKRSEKNFKKGRAQMPVRPAP
ncbi:MAG: hypothetical protein AAFZ15_04325 [Bacteroidota bacterium]